jgi:hypothetical protein
MKMGENWSQKRKIEKSNEVVFQQAISSGIAALLFVLNQYVSKKMELERVVKVAVLLIKSGVKAENLLFKTIAERCLAEEKLDGGWIGVEDTMWCVSFLKEFGSHRGKRESGLNWLKKCELKSGGWGKTDRDYGRIPVTGLLVYLLPELSRESNMNWLEKEWKKEFSLNPKLTYKGALTLMAFRKAGYQFVDKNLFEDTLSWLASEQNDDHGWGPGKYHPVGSSPLCTSIALAGLLQYPDKVDWKVIANGLKWIEKNQLENGLWADHYIEEGSAWCLYALTEGYRFLRESQ